MRRGFTLIEVLIVVVLIGVLASLVIPRLTGQPERGRTSEAYNILGVLRRLQLSWNDENNAFLDVDSFTAGAGSPWRRLGMVDITPPGSTDIFQYLCRQTGGAQVGCATGGTCCASRVGSGGWIRINLTTGVYLCDETVYRLDAGIGQCV